MDKEAKFSYRIRNFHTITPPPNPAFGPKPPVKAGTRDNIRPEQTAPGRHVTLSYVT